MYIIIMYRIELGPVICHLSETLPCTLCTVLHLAFHLICSSGDSSGVYATEEWLERVIVVGVDKKPTSVTLQTAKGEEETSLYVLAVHSTRQSSWSVPYQRELERQSVVVWSKE